MIDRVLQARLSRYVPAELLERIPEMKAIAGAIQTVNTLQRSVSSFLPSYLLKDESQLRTDSGNLRLGTFMFADVSGFTALSEHLRQASGTEGAEILTAVINDYFSTMLEILAKSEGQLLKFAGDALLIFFPAENNADEVPKAINAGLRMQRAMRQKFQPIQTPSMKARFGDGHGMELTMSIGLSRGKLFEALIGNAMQRDHIIQGTLPGQAMQAEEVGVRDEVIVDQGIRALVDERYTLKEIAPTFYQIIDDMGERLGDFEFSMPQRRRGIPSMLLDRDVNAMMAELENELERLELLSRYVASEVVNKLVINSKKIDSENRVTTTIFVHFTGFTELLELWGEESLPMVVSILARYYNLVQGLVARNGGSLIRSDPYKRGSKLLITFGAPVAYPDDPDRAVATALEMNRQLIGFTKQIKDELDPAYQRENYVSHRIGITQGMAYAGEVGWQSRREYTVMGDDVNLAARLMGKAEMGEILVSKSVWDRINQFFETEEQPPMNMKGKSEPVKAYLIKDTGRVSMTMARTSDTLFIGRDMLMLTLTMALQQSRNKQARVIMLTGEQGVGKTRLAKQFTLLAKNSEFKTAWVTCRKQNNRNTTWAAILSQLLGFTKLQSEEYQRGVLRQMLKLMGLLGIEETLSALLFGEKVEAQTGSRRGRQGRGTSGIFDRLGVPENTERKTSSGTLKRAGSNLDFWTDLSVKVSLSDALVSFISTYSKETPLLIVIDDLHKENPRAMKTHLSFLREIGAVQKLLGQSRLIFVATYEPELNPDLHDAQIIPVPDLLKDETLLMVSSILGVRELGPNLQQYIWENSYGRALFVEALLRTFMETNALDMSIEGMAELKPTATIERLPDTVQGLVVSRTDRLGAESKAVLRAAAVLGEQFSLTELAILSEIEDMQRMVGLVLRLTEMGMLEEQQAGVYAFRHGITQQAVYEELPRFQRHKMHLAAAEYYLQQPGEWTLVVAHHLVKAGALSRAIEVITQKTQQAVDNKNIDFAIDLLTYAQTIFPDDKAIKNDLEWLQQLRSQ